jgi:hypothetical protein
VTVKEVPVIAATAATAVIAAVTAKRRTGRLGRMGRMGRMGEKEAKLARDKWMGRGGSREQQTRGVMASRKTSTHRRHRRHRRRCPVMARLPMACP